jgi:hypothetical protein
LQQFVEAHAAKVAHPAAGFHQVVFVIHGQ